MSIDKKKLQIECFLNRFNRLKPHVVLDRLVFRKHYGLAIQIAKHLKLPESRILEHWAFHKVTFDKSKQFGFLLDKFSGSHFEMMDECIYFFQIDDDDVARKISEKLKLAGAQGISFCNIAKKAQELGRRNLAIKVMKFYFEEKFHQVFQLITITFMHVLL